MMHVSSESGGSGGSLEQVRVPESTSVPAQVSPDLTNTFPSPSSATQALGSSPRSENTMLQATTYGLSSGHLVTAQSEPSSRGTSMTSLVELPPLPPEPPLAPEPAEPPLAPEPAEPPLASEPAEPPLASEPAEPPLAPDPEPPLLAPSPPLPAVPPAPVVLPPAPVPPADGPAASPPVPLPPWPALPPPVPLPSEPPSLEALEVAPPASVVVAAESPPPLVLLVSPVDAVFALPLVVVPPLESSVLVSPPLPLDVEGLTESELVSSNKALSFEAEHAVSSTKYNGVTMRSLMGQCSVPQESTSAPRVIRRCVGFMVRFSSITKTRRSGASRNRFRRRVWKNVPRLF